MLCDENSGGSLMQHKREHEICGSDEHHGNSGGDENTLTAKQILSPMLWSCDEEGHRRWRRSREIADDG